MSRTGIVALVGLGCAAGAIAAALVLRDSLSTLERKVAALERAAANPVVPPEVAEVKERLVAMHYEVVAARSHAADLSMALAHTQQMLARQPAYSNLEQRLLGRFTSGKETQAFLPEGGDEKRDADWLWMALAHHARGVEKLQAYGRNAGSPEGYSVRVCARGVLGVPGRYGHTGGYQQFFLVSEILAVDAAAEAACRSVKGGPP
jgi:hypothetical protein